MAHDVFISYSSQDKLTADAVCHALEARGIRCWIAPRDILAGQSWKSGIVEAIRSAKVMVLIFSRRSNGSSQVQREVDIAFEAGHPIIPYRIEDVEMDEALYYCIGARHWLDALTPPQERHLDALVTAVAPLVQKELSEELPEAPDPAPSPVSLEPSSGREKLRRLALRTVPAGAVIGMLVLWLVSGWGLEDRLTTSVDVWSEAVTLVPSKTLDLVGVAQRSPGTSAGIPLDPPLVYIRGVEVRIPAVSDAAFEPEGDRALPASVLQHLSVTSACALHLDRLVDGSVRLGIVERLGEGDAKGDCKVRGQVWSGPPPEVPDSLLLASWLEVPPRQQVEVEASPSPGRPASLEFRSAEALRLNRIAVDWLAFETRERGPQVESAILKGTVRFPTLGDKVEQLTLRDTLLLQELDGEILELTLGDSIRTIYRGTASNPSISQRSLKPPLLQQLYHSAPLRVAVVLGVIIVGVAVFVARFL